MNYNLTPQEKNNYCACSVLQSIFREYRIEKSQEDIFRNLTPSEKGVVLIDEKFSEFVRSQGFNYQFYFYNETPFNEPDMILKEKGNMFFTWDKHVRLIENFEDPLVKFIDPLDGKKDTKDLRKVMNIMSKYKDGLFGIITQNDKS
jgi:hypothetical protein